MRAVGALFVADKVQGVDRVDTPKLVYGNCGT